MMNAKVRIQNVYDEILEETKQELVIVKDRKTFIGALFLRRKNGTNQERSLKKLLLKVLHWM